MKKPSKQKPSPKIKQLDKAKLAAVTGGGLSGPDTPGIITEIVPIDIQWC